MDQKWVKNGPKMVQKWINNGLKMDQKWFKNGLKMDQNRSKMDEEIDKQQISITNIIVWSKLINRMSNQEENQNTLGKKGLFSFRNHESG